MSNTPRGWGLFLRGSKLNLLIDKKADEMTESITTCPSVEPQRRISGTVRASTASEEDQTTTGARSASKAHLKEATHQQHQSICVLPARKQKLT